MTVSFISIIIIINFIHTFDVDQPISPKSTIAFSFLTRGSTSKIICAIRALLLLLPSSSPSEDENFDHPEMVAKAFRRAEADMFPVLSKTHAHDTPSFNFCLDMTYLVVYHHHHPPFVLCGQSKDNIEEANPP